MSTRGARAALCAILVLLSVIALEGSIDGAGASYTTAAMQRSLAAFGIARGINGVISAVQGTEVALQPAGIGITLAPGELLDPVNDLVERFSWVMLASTVSLGVQKILLEVAAWPPLTVAFAIVAAATVIGLWCPFRRRLLGGLLSLAVVLALLRLGAAGFALAGDGIYNIFLSERYDEASAGLERTSEEMRATGADPAAGADPDPGSIWARTKKLYESAGAAVDLEARVERLAEIAARMTAHVIDLAIVFTFQSLVLPLGFLWGFYALIARLPAVAGSWVARNQITQETDEHSQGRIL